MDYEKLKTAAQAITLPEERKRRIAAQCRLHSENTGKEAFMNSKKHIRKPAAALVVLVLCLTLTVTAFAATGVLKGFFRDITDFRGAVVGTSYEQATEEIRMSAAVSGNSLTVTASFAEPEKAPYSETEKLGIAAYKILDERGNTITEGSALSCGVVNGRAEIPLSLEDIGSGSYKLIVTAFVSEKKADQPLKITGNWECDFRK